MGKSAINIVLEGLARMLHGEAVISVLFFAAVMEASDVLCTDSIAMKLE